MEHSISRENWLAYWKVELPLVNMGDAVARSKPAAVSTARNWIVTQLRRMAINVGHFTHHGARPTCLRTALWSATGGRRVTAFGQKLSFAATTDVPDYRRFRLPRHSARDNGVQYMDYVQMRAIGLYLANLPGAPTVVEVGAYTAPMPASSARSYRRRAAE